jgi:peptide/nickel transport system substrate-binding protein
VSASRNAWRKAAVAAATAAIIVAGLAACSSNSASGTTSSRGSALTIQFQGVPISLSPTTGGSGGSAVFTALAYDPLIYETGDGTLVPDLATKWAFGDGNKTLTLTLRKGVKFMDGTTLNASVAKASMEAFLKAGGSNVADVGPISGITTKGADTLVVSYKSAFPDSAFYLSQYWGIGEIIGPKGLAAPKTLVTKSDGAGQYAYDAAASVSGSSYAYTRNPKYWNTSAQQYNKVTVKVIGDPTAVLSAATTGQVDFAGGIATTASSAQSAGLGIVTGTFFNWGMTIVDSQGTLVPALKNADVRQAIALAIDRKGIAAASGGKYATPNGQAAIPGTDGYVKGFGFDYDVTKAKALLAKGGYPNGFSLNVLTENVLDNQTTISQGIAADLGKIGIKVNLVVKTAVPDFIGSSLSKQYPAVIWPVVGTTSAQVETNFNVPGVTNPFGNKDAQLQSLYESALSGSTAAARTAGYEKITKYLNTLAWFAPVETTDNVYFVGKKIANVKASALNPNPEPQAPDAKYAWTPKK